MLRVATRGSLGRHGLLGRRIGRWSHDSASSRFDAARAALTRALDVGRAEGLRSLAIKALAATCYSRLALLERRLDEPVPELHGPLELDVGPLEPADAGEYAALVPGTSADEVRRRLAAGDVCLAARHHGRLVRVSWIVAGRVRIPYLRGTIALSPNEVLSERFFVAPEMRGKQVASVSTVHSLRWLQAAGYERLIAAVLPENLPAFRTFDKALGYRRIGTAYGIGLGPVRRVLVLARSGPNHGRLGRRRGRGERRIGPTAGR